MIQYLPLPAHVRRRRAFIGLVAIALGAGCMAGFIAFLMGAR